MPSYTVVHGYDLNAIAEHPELAGGKIITVLPSNPRGYDAIVELPAPQPQSQPAEENPSGGKSKRTRRRRRNV
jgi:hypothetical protein